MKRIPVSEGSVRSGYRPLCDLGKAPAWLWRGERLSDLSRAENGLIGLARIIREYPAHRVSGLLLINPYLILDLADEIEAARGERAPWESGVSRETPKPDGQGDKP